MISRLLILFLTVIHNYHVEAFAPKTSFANQVFPLTFPLSCHISSKTTHLPSNSKISHLRARPRSKWDDLTDEDDDEFDIADDELFIPTSLSSTDYIPKDMTYTESNIRRQTATFDKLVEVGGKDVVNDVYVRDPGGKEWWLVGKIARVSDISPEQAIERQWPLIDRHVWALRLPVRLTSERNSPVEVWYAPGDSELDAARNDPSVKFTKVEKEKCEGASEVAVALVGFVGKVYDARRGEPIFFVERDVRTGGVLIEREIEGDWVEGEDS